MKSSCFRDLENMLQNRPAILLDGGMGTLVMDMNLSEEDYRGEEWGHLPHSVALRGNHDLLNITQPERIKDIHRQYARAGADIVETATLSSQSISQAAYGMHDMVRRLNLSACRLCREVAEEVHRETGRRIFVAGSVGPTNILACYHSTTMRTQQSADQEGRGLQHSQGSVFTGFDKMSEAYREQCRALLDGGADIILIETIVDTLNAKAALFVLRQLFDSVESGGEGYTPVPVFVSVTVTQEEGYTIMKQSMPSFYYSLSHHKFIFAFGINCSFGPHSVEKPLSILADVVASNARTGTGSAVDSNVAAPHSTVVLCYPNAGMPPSEGAEDQQRETPEQFAASVANCVAKGWARIVGGCCGTSPLHTQWLASSISALPPPPGVHADQKMPDAQNGGGTVVVCGSRTCVALVKGETTVRVKSLCGILRPDGLVTLHGVVDEVMSIEDAVKECIQRAAEALALAPDTKLLKLEFSSSPLDKERVDVKDICYFVCEVIRQMGIHPAASCVPLLLKTECTEAVAAGLKCCPGRSIALVTPRQDAHHLLVEEVKRISHLGAVAGLLLPSLSHISASTTSTSTDHSNHNNISNSCDGIVSSYRQVLHTLLNEMGLSTQDILIFVSHSDDVDTAYRLLCPARQLTIVHLAEREGETYLHIL